MYPGEEPVEKRRQTAFCIPKGMEQFKWQIANGTFNPPSRVLMTFKFIEIFIEIVMKFEISGAPMPLRFL